MEERFQPEELVPHSDVFGPALQRVRTSLQASQKELGEHALVASSTIATYETGHREPSPEAIVGIAVACGVEPSSAAQHGRLLVEKFAMRRDARGLAQIASTSSLGRLTLGVARGTAIPPVVVAVAAGFAGAQVARAVRNRRAGADLTDVAGQKLLAKALAARPLPAAEARGIYPLVETPSRKQLERELAGSAEALDDDELMALVAALRRESTPKDG